MDLFHIYLTLLVAMVAYMSAWFAFGSYLKRLDVVDSAWGLGFIFVIIVTANTVDGLDLVQWLALLFVGIWGLRLFGHITNRNRRKSEDARYAVYRQKWQKWFELRAYFQIYLVQGALLLLISTPVILLLQTTNKNQAIVTVCGFLVWGFGIIFEAVADYQLQRFLSRPDKQKSEVMSAGLWHYSRHPNYFGEITAWWGAAIVAIGAGQWWGILGAAVITFLIVKVSGIPLLEKRHAQNPAYRTYRQKTSLLFPLPVRKQFTAKSRNGA